MENIEVHAAIFGGIGTMEWLIILAVALLLFGSRLPTIMRGLGSSVKEFKKGMGDDAPAAPAAPAPYYPPGTAPVPQPPPGYQLVPVQPAAPQPPPGYVMVPVAQATAQAPAQPSPAQLSPAQLSPAQPVSRGSTLPGA